MNGRLRRPAPCECCNTVRQYIAEHLDPGAFTQPDEDPAAVLAIFDLSFEGEGSGLTVEDVAAYLEDLRDIAQADLVRD